MIGVITYVHNPLNFDVIFPYDDSPYPGAKPIKRALCFEYDKESDEFKEPIERDVYQIRLKGLTRKDIKFKDGMQKHRLIQKLNRSGCLVLVDITSIDTYKRLEATVRDPVEKFSYSEWLLQKYPDIYHKYRDR